MAIRYPGSNMQELNLDWVLGKVKEMSDEVKEEVKTTEELSEAVQENIEQVQNAIMVVNDTVYAVEEMTVESSTLPPGSDATVTKSRVDGHINLAFGIPQGIQGVPGQDGAPGTPATDAQVQTAVNTWLSNNVDPDSGYVLDSTLSQPLAASPADAVGDIKAGIALEFDASQNYPIGRYVWYQGSLYCFYKPHTAGDSWSYGEVVLTSVQGGLRSSMNNTAPFFDTSTAYSSGEYVVYQNNLYQFNTDHVAGAWNSSEVIAVKVMTELSDLNNQINEHNQVIGLNSPNLFDSAQFLEATGWAEAEGVYSGTVGNLFTKYNNNTNAFAVFGGFKENTQYSIRCQFYTNNTPVSSGNIIKWQVYYTDNTNSGVIYFDIKSSWTQKTATTASGKTVQKMVLEYSNGSAATNILYLKDFQIIEGATQKQYQPYLYTAFDYGIRNILKTTSFFDSWFRGTFNGNGTWTVSGNGAISTQTKVYENTLVTAEANSRFIVAFYDKNYSYIGKVGADGTISTDGGNWMFFTGEDNNISNYKPLNAEFFIICLLPTDSTTITEANKVSWANSHCHITNNNLERVSEDLYDRNYPSYVIGADSIKEQLFIERLGELTYYQSFCVYNNKYYSTDGSNIGVQNSDFTPVSTKALSLGHGNAFQLGNNGKAYVSGWNDQNVYVIDLSTVEIDSTITLPTTGYTTAVIDDLNKIAYIFQRDSLPDTETNYNFIVYDYQNNQTISTRVINSFAAMQAADFYNGRIAVLYGLGENTIRTGLTIYNTLGDIISEFHFNILQGAEPEGVFFDRYTGELFISLADKTVFKAF